MSRSRRRRLVIGDVHGSWRALQQVLERANFNPEHDTLISAGDLVDGWPETRELLDYVLGLPSFIWVMGNHDAWCLEWLNGAPAERWWVEEGGQATIDSLLGAESTPGAITPYLIAPQSVRTRYATAFRAALPFYEDGDILVVHGGFDPRQPLDRQSPESLRSDRSLASALYRGLALPPGAEPLTRYRAVFLGHTVFRRDGFAGPVRRQEFWLIDQGAGWDGPLTLVDADSGEWWQSDPSALLYPEAPGRIGARQLRLAP